MKIYELWEECQQHFQNVGLNQFLLDYNKEYKYFAHETRILTKQANLPVVANTVEYTLLTEFTDIDGELVKDILFYNSSNELLTDSDTLKFTIINGKIKFYDYYGEDISEIPSTISTITFIYVYIPTDLTSLGTPVLDDQFQKAPLYKTLKNYYATFPSITRQFTDGSIAQTKDLNSAAFWGNEYKVLEIAGKRKANEYTPMHTNNYGKGF